jgi:hypothetical protein
MGPRKLCPAGNRATSNAAQPFLDPFSGPRDAFLIAVATLPMIIAGGILILGGRSRYARGGDRK